MIWLYECTRKESIHLNQRNRTREQPDTHHNDRHRANPADEDKFGIDFWHAVEFSRSGRTPTRRLSATRRGNPSSLDPRSLAVKSPAGGRGISIARSASNFSGGRDIVAGGVNAHSVESVPGGLPGGTDHLSVSVPPCRATSRTLGSAPRGVKSTLDHVRTSSDVRW